MNQRPLGLRIIRRPLLPSESLSSWLIRVSRDNAFSLHELVTRLIERSVHHESSVDLDLGLSKRLTQAVIDHELATLDQLAAASLAHKLDAIGGYAPAARPPRWLSAPTGNASQPGSFAYCAACWQDDPAPHFRAAWRTSWSVACLRHGTWLIDRCPVCAEPNPVFRSMQQVKWANLRLSTCLECYADLRCQPALAADAMLLQWQSAMDAAAKDRWARIGTDLVAAPAYFHGMAVLLRMIRTTRSGQSIRSIILDDSTAYNRREPFDRLEVSARRVTLTVLVKLLEDWPHGFYFLGRRVRLRSTDLTDLGYEVPFWLATQIRAFDRTWYQPSKEEATHVAGILADRAGIKAQGIVREWLGALVSKPSIRSSREPLDDPVQLGLFDERRLPSDVWLRQMFAARISRTLRQYVLKRAVPSLARGRRAQTELALVWASD